jgi:hemolysin activation/secretion protein
LLCQILTKMVAGKKAGCLPCIALVRDVRGWYLISLILVESQRVTSNPYTCSLFMRTRIVPHKGNPMALTRVLGMLGGLSVGVALIITPANAQSSTGAPTREEINRAPALPAPSNDGQRVTVQGGVERAPCPLADDQFKDIKVTLQSVDFANLKGVAPDGLRPAYARWIGQSIPLSTVCDIRDEAATILRKSGYLAAVQVPPQRIENGVIKFDVLMAKLVGFQVRGDASKAEGLISGYLNAIKNQPVFNIIDAERYLLLARDIPGYDVRLTLRPAGTVPGEVIGEVQVIRTPVEIQTNIQNYGSNDVGRFGGLVQAKFNGLFGAGDRTTIGGFTTADFDEQQVLQIGEEVRVGREGLTLMGDFTYAWTHPSLGAGINLRSRTLVASLSARYPLIRRQSKSLYASGGLELINQNVTFGGTLITTDKLRILFAKLDFDASDPDSVASPEGYSAAEPKWRLGGSIELRKGLDILGASQDCGVNFVRCSTVSLSRIEGKPTAFVARASGYAEYRPVPILAFSIAPRLQYSSSALLSYEEFSAGNFTVGRGYDPGTIIGDSGVGVTSEVKLGSLVPQGANKIAIQGYGFVDTAWVWNRDTPSIPLNPENLISVGGGLRFAYGDRARLDLGIAAPLVKAGQQTALGDVRFLMNLTVKLFPWSRR